MHAQPDSARPCDGRNRACGHGRPGGEVIEVSGAAVQEGEREDGRQKKKAAGHVREHVVLVPKYVSR